MHDYGLRKETCTAQVEHANATWEQGPGPDRGPERYPPPPSHCSVHT